MRFSRDVGLTAGVLGTAGPATEFNIFEGLWDARVTSHVPMAGRGVANVGVTRAALLLAAEMVHRAG